jgi:hypothetical protein
MNEFAGFASRYHKLKQSLQEIEENQYARLLQEEHVLKSEWLRLNEAHRTARVKQGESHDVRRWQEYQFYGDSLVMKKDTLEREWETLKGTVSSQQIRLQDAFVEQEKWSRVAESAWSEVHAVESQQLQKDADDEALKRFRKADD